MPIPDSIEHHSNDGRQCQVGTDNRDEFTALPCPGQVDLKRVLHRVLVSIAVVVGRRSLLAYDLVQVLDEATILRQDLPQLKGNHPVLTTQPLYQHRPEGFDGSKTVSRPFKPVCPTCR